MAHYGSGGIAPQVKNASGIRLLGVHPSIRNRGVGRALTVACIGYLRLPLAWALPALAVLGWMLARATLVKRSSEK